MRIKHLILSPLIVALISFYFLGLGLCHEVYSPVEVSAENTWTEPICVPGMGTTGGPSALSVTIKPITSDTVMTIRLQCKYDEETTWGHEVDVWDIVAGNVDYVYRSDPVPDTVYYRIGCTSGNYTSGTIKLRLGTGWK
jgi:hypothetical protein